MLATALSYLLIYKYPLLFFIAFSSAIIIPWPTNLIIIAAGAFANHGYFNLIYIILIVQIANVSGDLLEYLFIRKYGNEILRQKFIKNNSFFLTLEKTIKDNKRITIFLSRFVGLFSVSVNFLAGFTKISFFTFLIYDFLGNLVSNSLFIILGYKLGDYWENFSGLINNINYIIIIIFLIFILIKIKNKKK